MLLHRLIDPVALTIALAGSLVIPNVAAAQAKGDAAHGGTLYLAQCSLCHGPAGEGGQGPSLQDVVGRKAGTTDFGYSAALRRAAPALDAEGLDRFLANPQAVAPGTTMGVRVASADERRDLVAYLATLKAADRADAITPAGERATFDDWRGDAPGRRYRITPADLPAPFATDSARNASQVVSRPAGVLPRVPKDFAVSVFAERLAEPRQLRVAPNGDVFVTETDAGRVTVLRPDADGTRSQSATVFATGLAEPFGLAFLPASKPEWLYVAETNRVVRYRYAPGMTKADGSPEVVLARLSPTSSGHSNRDMAVSNDGRWIYVGVGSASNVADGMAKKTLAEAKAIDATRGLGAAWDGEAGRAQVLAFTPDGKDTHAYATGLRNCSGIAVQPSTDAVWCSTNERDRLGDDLVPDYVTRVTRGAFYGWPWWYIGDHEDPRRAGERPDLKGRVTVPDVLLQPHSASLGIAFADGAKVPAAWKGSAFVAEHGSWNRANRTGPKLIRIVMNADGTPTGAYEDVMTGFVLDDRRVWGRPVGVAVARDGSLLVADDAGGVVWRLVYTGT